MSHFAVRTLTLNPSIDVSSEADKVEPTRKVRTCRERIDPGGGGINVARVLHRFGTKVEAIFLAGGATGEAFDALLGKAGLTRRWVRIDEDTRASLAIHERSTGKDYRFVPEGPTLQPQEIEACRKAIAAATCDYLVASGSLPPGVPDDFYVSVAAAARENGARFVLDTSSEELRDAVAAGGIHLLKASVEELGRDDAEAIVRAGHAEHVTLTLGGDGALLVGTDGTYSLAAAATDPLSTVGAGDSFLAGMVFGLASGETMSEAFRLAVACGAAATLSAGTDLCYADDALRLLPSVGTPQRL
jgi:6-phosphofructokinase 2